MWASIPIKQADRPKEPSEVEHYKRRPSDLPIYTPLHCANEKPDDDKPHPPQQSYPLQVIEEAVRAVRITLTSGYHLAVEKKKHLDDLIATGITHSQSTIDYLNQPDNTFPRVGAIAIGGASGLILAIRGGLVRKIIYTGIGAGGIASLCYPKETEKFAQQGLLETKKGVAIAYNFVKGVKPGDEDAAESMKNFPTSIASVKEIVNEWIKTVFPSK